MLLSHALIPYVLRRRANLGGHRAYSNFCVWTHLSVCTVGAVRAPELWEVLQRAHTAAATIELLILVLTCLEEFEVILHVSRITLIMALMYTYFILQNARIGATIWVII